MRVDFLLSWRSLTVPLNVSPRNINPICYHTPPPPGKKTTHNTTVFRLLRPSILRFTQYVGYLEPVLVITNHLHATILTLLHAAFDSRTLRAYIPAAINVDCFEHYPSAKCLTTFGCLGNPGAEVIPCISYNFPVVVISDVVAPCRHPRGPPLTRYGYLVILVYQTCLPLDRLSCRRINRNEGRLDNCNHPCLCLCLLCVLPFRNDAEYVRALPLAGHVNTSLLTKRTMPLSLITLLLKTIPLCSCLSLSRLCCCFLCLML